MLRKTVMIAFYEARMSSRGWRFWLLLGLLTGISLFARRDYLQRVEEGVFLHSGFSFQHPSFWLMLSILGLGACALALDICGRLRHNRMDKILFPLPVGSMQLMFGRLFGVLSIIIPLSAIGIFSLAFWQYLYGHGVVIWQPFIIAFFLIVLPIVIPVTALAITLRTFFKHDFASLVVGAVIGGVCAVGGYHLGLWVNVPDIIRQLVNSSPTIGTQVLWQNYEIQLAMHGLFSLACLSLAPLYLRRQEPQRWIVRRSRNALFSIALLIRLITNLRPDRHLGWGYRLFLMIVIVCSTGGALWATYRYNDFLSKNGNTLAKDMTRVKFPSIRVDVKKYTLSIAPSQRNDQVEIEAQLTFAPLEATKYLGVELDRKFKVEEAFLDEDPSSFAQQNNRVRFNFRESLQPGEEHTLLVRYHGIPTDFHTCFSSLQTIWYPVPWRKIQTEKERWINIDDDLFQADIILHLDQSQRGAFAGDLVDTRMEGTDRIEHWRTLYPIQSMQLFWGYYGSVEIDQFGYRMRFFHLPTHDYQARVYMEEIKEQQEYVHNRLGRLPFPQLTLIETPYRWYGDYIPRRGYKEAWIAPNKKQATQAQPMPGTILVSENQLSYLHEDMWLLERLDHDPRTIAFYQMLEPTLEQVHDQFYRKLISAYFDDSIHPAGPMAFWVNAYLSSYASKLLERNPWRRNRELRYDVGDNAKRPLSIAKSISLLDLHKMGEYPELERIRGEGLFRMLHHLLGEKTWWAFLREIFRRYRFQEIPVEELLPLAEEFYGDDLGWFVDQWINGTALPEYEITYTDAKIIEDPRTSKVQYETSIRVKNHGEGRMAVPIYLETEMDYVMRNLWLDSHEEKTLTLTVPHRPIYAKVDPQYWVVQVPHLDEVKKSRMHSEKRILIEGDDTTALRQNSQRKGGRRRHFWRHR